LFCVTLPDEIRYGIGVRICAPSMPCLPSPAQVVAGGAPGGLLLHLDVRHAVFGEQTLVLGDEQRASIAERDEAEFAVFTSGPAPCAKAPAGKFSLAAASRAAVPAVAFRILTAAEAAARGLNRWAWS